MSIALSISPHGRLVVLDTVSDQVLPDGHLCERIRQAFSESQAHGLLQLGARELTSPLPPEFAWARDFACRYLTALCRAPEVSGRSELPALPAPDSEQFADARASSWTRLSSSCHHWAKFVPRFPRSCERQTIYKDRNEVFAMGWGGEWGYRPYVPVAQRRANALRAVKRFVLKGQQISPVQIDGRVIASTFWGKAWCDNLESYSDFENRLPRGRTYARNGSVIDLQIEPGKITSLVSGSSLYRITIEIRPLDGAHWKKLKGQCGAGIASVVELLQGRLSTSVMSVVTCRENGLFPAPAEIEMSCSCPDWAGMCKHIAATLYGVGNRLDRQPELLFKLRQVDHLELIARAGNEAPKLKSGGKKTIAKDRLADIFGIELEAESETADARQESPTEIPRGTAEAPRSKAKTPRGKKTATPKKKIVREKKKPVPANAARTPDEAPAAPRHTAGSQLKPLTPAARKRIAEAQRRRWRALREKCLSASSNGTEVSSAPTAKTSKAQPAKPARNKVARRLRAE